jgi:poly(3-hydroxybutyrate) depolymerase
MKLSPRSYWNVSLRVLLAAVVIPSVSAAQTWQDFQVGNVTRKALVYVPDGLDEPPLLISLHGRGIPASWNQGEMMKFEPIADREKFIVVYPEALNDLNWDLGGTTDIDFVLKIIDDMSTQHSIDRGRVYASGFSMGGMFSHTLACRIPDKIAAIAPGNGYPLGGLSGCAHSRHVPIFHMHGTADDFVAYSGIHDFLGTRAAAYGCPPTPVKTEPYPVGKTDSKSFKEYFGPCPNDDGTESEIVLISVAGMIHDWATAGKANTNEDPEFQGKPFDIDGSEEAWAFLKTHSLEGKIGDGGSGGGGSSGSGSGGSPGSGGASGGAGGGGNSSVGGSGMFGSGGTGLPTGSGGNAAGASGAPGAGMGTSGAGATNSAPSSGCTLAGGQTSGTGPGFMAFLLGLSLGLRRRKSERATPAEALRRSRRRPGRTTR